VALLAAGLRLGQAGESLWLDELHTAWAAGSSLVEVAPRSGMGNQSPLFFWLEWLLLRLLGNSELTLRLPSIVASSLLPLALYWLLSAWNERGAGLLAAVLVAIDPAAIFSGTEARPYALLQLLAVVHVTITARLLDAPAKKLHLWWVGLAAVLFYLHYTAALLIAAEAAFVVAVRLFYPRRTVVKFGPLVADGFLVVALCLFAGGPLAAVFQRRTNWSLFVHHAPFQQMFGWWPLALSGWYLAAALVADHLAPRPADEPEDARAKKQICWLLCLLWLLLPAAIAWVATMADIARLFHPRYLAASAPAAFVAAGLAMNVAPGIRSKWLVSLLLVTASLISGGIVGRSVHGGRPIAERREDWRSAIAWLNEQLPSHHFPVLVYSGLIEADALTRPHDRLFEDYCLLPVTALYPIAARRDDLFPLPYNEPGRLNKQLRMPAVNRGGAWLVVRGSRNLAERIAEQLFDELQGLHAPGSPSAAAWQIADRRSFGQVQVVLIAPQPADAR
jgi:hypothetical protein